jgi:hypothetical protein
MSQSEKSALVDILAEEKDYKDKLSFLKQKKEREREDRLKRLDKIKIKEINKN